MIEQHHTTDSMVVLAKDGRNVESRYLINAAGLGALSIARSMGFGDRYDMLPLKGHYMISDKPMPEVKTLVYPLPTKLQTLGPHSTLMTDGYVKVGPSAGPAFSFENYQGMKGFMPTEFGKIVGYYL